jgi:hypothetical protein
MTTISLSTYTIRIKDSNGDYQPVDCFSGSRDLFGVLQTYLRALQTGIYYNANERCVLRVPRLEKQGRLLHGQMEKGEFGIESQIMNTKSGLISYKRIPLDAELLPYYFLIAVPRNAKEAIAILQMSGPLGIKTDFEENFRGHFRKDFPALSIEINRLVPAQFAERFMQQARVTEIRFIQYGVRRDIAEMVSLGPKEYEGVIELRVKARRGKDFQISQRIREVANQKRNLKEFMTVQDFSYDDVKLQMAKKGKYYTLDLGHLENLRAQYDITEQVAGTAGDEPSYEHIKKQATKLCLDIAKGMGLELEVGPEPKPRRAAKNV